MHTPEPQSSPPPRPTDAHAYVPIISLYALVALISYLLNWHVLPSWLRYVWLGLGIMQLLSARTIKVQNPKSITECTSEGESSSCGLPPTSTGDGHRRSNTPPWFKASSKATASPCTDLQLCC